MAATTDPREIARFDGNASVDVNIEPDDPQKYTTNLSDLQKKSKNLSRMNEKGFVNENTGSAMVIREDGQINLSSSKYSQVKLNPNGTVMHQAINETIMANRIELVTDEVVINHHKLNPALWELTDYKEMKLPTTKKGREAIIGNLNMQCSVLVRAWDHQLKRYMLIRRPAWVPLFSKTLNVPEINPGSHVEDPLFVDDSILAKSEAGYQVNAFISDKNSLIGKEGVNRSGSAVGTTAVASGTGNTSAGSGTARNGHVEKAVQWAIGIANDQSHGYSQADRTGPDFDCSSFVYYALQAGGFGIIDHRGYAGNCETIWEDLAELGGWQKLSYGEAEGSLQRGDILNNPDKHAAICIGGGQTVEASGISHGSSETGDQGDEIGFRDATGRDFTEVYRYIG